jgi:dihydropteroate synthase
MGIVNVTPDSFSDGGQFMDTDKAVAHALELVEEGAQIIDIGGESTRPGAMPVDEAEELQRVLPVIKQLSGHISVPLSIDTMKPKVARAALEAGASIVNDVAANRTDSEMWRVVAEAEAGYVCMHMQTTPNTRQDNPVSDIVAEVSTFFIERLERLKERGVSGEQVIFDPGIGFGKNVEHNLLLIAGLSNLTRLGRPVMLGASRKSFMGKLLGAEITRRLPAGLACACWAVQAGVQVLRTHDVSATVQAVRMTEALLAKTREDVAAHSEPLA